MNQRYRFAFAAALLLGAAGPMQAQAPDSAFAVSAGGMGLFRVDVHGGALFGGEYAGGLPAGGIPAEGPGTRMMWYPERAAFRAGDVNGMQWDDGNIGEFSVAIGQNVRASGDNGVAFGMRTTAAGQSSFAVGEENTASGAASVALGYHAHTNARQGSFVFADRSSVDTLRAGVNHSANWRVAGGFRIFTSSNLSTGVTIQEGSSVSNWGQTNAVISTSTGAMLTTGGVWQNASDVALKRDFADVAGEEVLAKLRGLPVSTWSYKVEEAGVRHMGPTAQDFRAAFGLGTSDTSIGTVDADGVALAAAKALERRTAEQAEELRRQAARIDALERRNAELAERLARLETLLSSTSR